MFTNFYQGNLHITQLNRAVIFLILKISKAEKKSVFSRTSLLIVVITYLQRYWLIDFKVFYKGLLIEIRLLFCNFAL
jgi:hypothetical protein